MTIRCYTKEEVGEDSLGSIEEGQWVKYDDHIQAMMALSEGIVSRLSDELRSAHSDIEKSIAGMSNIDDY